MAPLSYLSQQPYPLAPMTAELFLSLLTRRRHPTSPSSRICVITDDRFVTRIWPSTPLINPCAYSIYMLMPSASLLCTIDVSTSRVQVTAQNDYISFTENRVERLLRHCRCWSRREHNRPHEVIRRAVAAEVGDGMILDLRRFPHSKSCPVSRHI